LLIPRGRIWISQARPGSDKSTPTVPKGGTGYGVRLLNRLV